MRAAGWIIAGYLLAVITVAIIIAVALVIATATSVFGPALSPSSEEPAAFLGKLVGAGLVAYAPIYLGTRLVLKLFSTMSLALFALAFLVPSVLVFAGLAQLPEVWMVNWVSEPGDYPELVIRETVAALFWGGFGVGPFFFTTFGVAFWCAAGACFGFVIWWSERRALKFLAASRV